MGRKNFFEYVNDSSLSFQPIDSEEAWAKDGDLYSEKQVGLDCFYFVLAHTVPVQQLKLFLCLHSRFLLNIYMSKEFQNEPRHNDAVCQLSVCFLRAESGHLLKRDSVKKTDILMRPAY